MRPRCPHCGSRDTVFDTHDNDNDYDEDVWFCRACKRNFIF